MSALKIGKYYITKNDHRFLLRKVAELTDENQELKRQLENCYCNRTDCSSRIKNSKKYDSLVQKVENQQKEFIEWLENEIKIEEETFKKYGSENINNYYAAANKVTLEKYKEILK